MIDLIVGIIADTAVPERVDRLLRDLRAVQELDTGLREVRVVLLLNPSAAPEPGRVAALLSGHRRRGLSIDTIAPDVGAPPGRLPIANARTLLQRRCAREARGRDPACVWILDEDLRLGPLLTQLGRGLRVSGEVRRARRSGADVLLSPILGAPPLPARSMVRVNLEDVHRHLVAMAGLAPQDPWPDRREENREARRLLAEYYYDFSCAHGDAAALPMWLEPAHPGERVRDSYLRLCAAAAGLIHGQPITRELRLDAGQAPPTPPLCRGGNTLVLRPDLLLRFPNPAPRIRGRLTRRSDMIWARLACYRGGARFSPGPLLASQDRSGPGQSDFSAEKLLDDVRGSALVKAIDALLAPGPPDRAPGRVERAIDAYGRHAGARLGLIRRSEAAVRARLESMGEALATDLAQGERWFITEPACRQATLALQRSLSQLAAAYGEKTGEETAHQADADADAEILEVRAFLDGLLRTTRSGRRRGAAQETGARMTPGRAGPSVL